MPRTRELIVDHGTEFTNYYDATPLCCPSRAGVLTGQYGHNNGVLSNVPGYGDLAEQPRTSSRSGCSAPATRPRGRQVAERLREHGRRQGRVAPGWDKWYGRDRRRPRLLQLQARRQRQQARRRYKDASTSPTWINQRAVDRPDPPARPATSPSSSGSTSSRRTSRTSTPTAAGRCGGEAVPAARDLGRFEGAGLPRLAVDQRAGRLRQARDSSPASRADARPAAGARAPLRVPARGAAGLDRAIGRIVQALRQTGELDDTVVIFASDNGTFHGEHRLPGGKGLAYEEAAHMPMAIRVPPKYRGRRRRSREDRRADREHRHRADDRRLAGVADLRPEVGECRVMDGRSLAALFDRRQERLRSRPTARCDRAAPERRRGRSRAAGSRARTQGVRDGRWLYVAAHVAPRPGYGPASTERRDRALRHRARPVRAPEPRGRRSAASRSRRLQLTAGSTTAPGSRARPRARQRR